MKNKLLTLFFVVTFFALSAPSASAVTNGVVKVGLRYGSSALASANLENAEGAGYEFGYYDADRRFVSLGRTDVTTITMSLSGGSSISVTRTNTSEVLYEHNAGDRPLGVRPAGNSTWFKGYRYAGGFEYVPAGAGGLKVVNVVDLEDYVKGVVPYEMPGDWPLAALEAQAVCARTFVQGHNKHLRDEGFDVCNGVDCQVYNGRGTGRNEPSADSDRAVENTAGLCIYYNGTLVQDAVYHSSDGGATEDGYNVWGTETGYLKGKADPYESRTSVPNNSWSVTYTAAELSWILDQKGHSVGTVQDVYVSEYTPLGNVRQVTFVGSAGTKTFTGDDCRMIFYSSTYQKSVSSMRFDINGRRGGSGGLYVNGAGLLSSLDGASVISGGGTTGTLRGNSASVITSSGTVTVSCEASRPSSGGGSQNGNFVITGTGNGHNVGMSQYGAKAMAEQGYGFQEILNFYYTDITIR
ncbi:SpoIID/LytB domain-containing protein [uncultured Oscillibacter sp.]|uniref:SpoIID/LytB domain-containing protein n=1 Tax=uncultured Oscillibacter sp. TaxID=876091 RepID=UPI00262A5A00|nr:SpoIID/LytB domain-containing protein [uncultured Oscillibacter sp.]